MATGNDAVNAVLGDYESKLTAVAPKAVGIQLGLFLALSLACLVGFMLLRTNNSVIYAPRYKFIDPASPKRPPKIQPTAFGWLKPLVSVHEKEMLVIVGLDSVCFLRFLRMCRWMFGIVALLSCGVLIPVNLVYNLKNVESDSRNPLSSIAITNVKGNILYTHVAVLYLITLIVAFFLWRNFAAMCELRWEYFRGEEYQHSVNSRSVMITQIPKKLQSDAGVRDIITERCNIEYPTTDIAIGRRVGHLPELIRRHNNAVKALEEAFARYSKNFPKVPAQRPRTKVGSRLGMGGNTVDTFEFLLQKVEMYKQKIELERANIRTKKAENYGFASFQSPPYAHIVAERLEGHKAQGAEIELAPLPEDIIWENVVKGNANRGFAKFWIGLGLALVMVVYTIPLVAVSFLANLTSVAQYVNFLERWSTSSPASFAAVTGILPPVLSLLLQAFLPSIIRVFARKQGALTHTQLDRDVLGWYFGFTFATNVIIFSLIGVAFTFITEVVIEVGKSGGLRAILGELSRLPDRVQNTYVSQSNYWLTWFPVRTFAAFFDLAQVVNIGWIWLRTRLFGRTPRDIKDWTKPREFDTPVYTGDYLLMVAVALVYAPLAPLVTLFAAVSFFLSTFVYKYQMLYVSETESESGGRLWRVLSNRIIFCTAFMQAIMTLTIGLQRGWIYCTTCVPALAFLLIFGIVLNRHFDQRFRWYIPDREEIIESTAGVNVSKRQLDKKFGHPSLHIELFYPVIDRRKMGLWDEVTGGQNQTHLKAEGVDEKQLENVSAVGVPLGVRRASDFNALMGQSRPMGRTNGSQDKLLNYADSVVDPREYAYGRDDAASYKEAYDHSFNPSVESLDMGNMGPYGQRLPHGYYQTPISQPGSVPGSPRSSYDVPRRGGGLPPGATGASPQMRSSPQMPRYMPRQQQPYDQYQYPPHGNF
ncbi:uncharacterized protein L969DRAFT_43529 [Mixia osmundae IAM 14324]|uniref:CSC1/OSCA1-like 7TM region domain-containing protein n=1 Tax=Mixia osmundae (strain CBS 9802 / IAM 14324 / JCM 22182 / KY 12970) TaxID=764103 RepID=G7E0B8_MIXOS|nr:uncharacterized protein L969DRAFT_43529 [Mixia osmundae IAM 14324]KEI42270.1 hypothetical protein L969DRAFT_43529 [Mixia osmundae IAM 14324]GAA96278.1 hypothetical protein E5Q_02944 [Mixia osmundae IAM 14324]